MTPILEARGLSAWYGPRQALRGVSLDVRTGEVLGIIGPANAGKTTFLRTLNRMNDLVPGFRKEGAVLFRGTDVYRNGVDVSALRRRLGMVFAIPVVLPMSVHRNLTFGPRMSGRSEELEARMEACLRAAYLWDEVKDRLHEPALNLSGGQQQRLCLARTLMLEPDVLLLDEPTSGLDPISTARIEEALVQLKKRLPVVLVTNNVMQAARISDRTAFFLDGRVVECGDTESFFVRPREKETHDYITGRFG